MNMKLAAKITARNNVNFLANQTMPKILAALAPFVGQKVRLKEGGMTSKVIAVLRPFYSDARCARVWFNVRPYGLEVHFQVVVGGENSSTMQEHGCDLGRVENGILSKIYDHQPLRTDWTSLEVEKSRTDAQAAREAMHAAEFAFRHFGTHDHN